MSDTASPVRPRAIVIGGSLGGLFAGAVLRQSGWDVDIFERSKGDLDSRGGGIVLQPDVVELFARVGVDIAAMDLGVVSRDRIVIDPDGSIGSRQLAPQTQTSWSLIYGTMRKVFGDQHYHRGKRLTDIQQSVSSPRVTATFEDSSSVTGDLLIGADGGQSTVRALLWPNAEPCYAGYVAWRGLLAENLMPPVTRASLLGDFAFATSDQSHMLGYLVPGERNDTRPEHRIYNWVWYRAVERSQLRSVMTDVVGRYRGTSVPEGLLSPQWRDRIWLEADALLPPAFRDLVRATPEPFVQAIQDLTVESMVKDRVVLLGDAAFIPRPHTAASTSKAAANALMLGDALTGNRNIDAALAAWQPHQLRLGYRLYEDGSSVGDHLLFGGAPARRARLRP